MEGLIIVIVISIISALFNKDKKKPQQQKQNSMPTFGQQQIPEKSDPVPQTRKPAARSLEDFANEIFGQLNEKTEQKRPTVKVTPMEPVKVAPVVETVRETFQSNRSERAPLAERAITKRIVQQEQKINFVPKSREDLVQAIVMAEVLGRPKAKQN